MSDSIVPGSSWSGSDFQQPPRTDGGVALCGACRRTGLCRLGLTTEHLDEAGHARFEIECSSDNEGGPGVAHGGWTAAVLDEVLGHAPILHGQMAVTGTLTVRFVKPVPLERPLEARSWIERVDGSKWYVAGELVLASSGAVLATADGVWVARDHGSHFGNFERWLAAQGGSPAEEG